MGDRYFVGAGDGTLGQSGNAPCTEPMRSGVGLAAGKVLVQDGGDVGEPSAGFGSPYAQGEVGVLGGAVLVGHHDADGALDDRADLERFGESGYVRALDVWATGTGPCTDAPGGLSCVEGAIEA